MKNKNIILLMLMLSFTYSCNNPENIIKDYYFLSSDEASDIGYPYGTTIYQTKHKNSFEKILITADIQKVDVIDDFILVVQSPNLEKFKLQIQEQFSIPIEIDSSFISLNNMNINERQELAKCIDNLKGKNTRSIDTLKSSLDSLFTQKKYLSNYFKHKHYFIIDTQKDILSKPMDLKTFKKDCELRGIDYEDFLK